MRKKITYTYLDNYRPTTRVYEVANDNIIYNDPKSSATLKKVPDTAATIAASSTSAANAPTTIDLFNAKNGSLNYLVKPFDAAHVAESVGGKPSQEQVNKYLTVVNTGVKNPDLIQIHPLLSSKTEIKTSAFVDAPDPTTSMTFAFVKLIFG